MKEIKRGMMICCCDSADKNCYLTCPKGRKINPVRVYNTPWRCAIKKP